MPLHLEPMDLSIELRRYRSILFVTCPVCPQTSLATDTASPVIELFKHGIQTPAYRDYLQGLRDALEKDGIRTGAFTSYLPCPTTCLWSAGQRMRLRRRARAYELAVVMGCASAQSTVEEALRDTACDVMIGMRLVGITNARLKFGFPFTVRLEEPRCVDAD